MSFTKVAPAGIGTSPGTSILIGDSLLHSTGIDIGSNTGVGVTIRQHGDATFTGIVTAASFSGDITGKATELSTNATGTNLTLSGNLGVGGVLTYEDVTNIDSVGVVTARSGIKIGPTAGVAGTFFADGSYVTAGIITAKTGSFSGTVTANSFSGDGSSLTGIDATQIVTGNTSVQTVDTGSDGHVKINTEGTERLRIFSDGKFGFGTNSLSETTMAEFSSSTGGGAIGSNITIRNSSTNSVNNIAELRLKTAHGVARIFKYNTSETVFMSHHGGASDLIMQADGASNFKVNTNGAERLRITSRGLLLGGSDASDNTTLGGNAGDSFTGPGDAIQNTLIGKDAGTAVTSGDYNTAVGKGALDAVTGTSENTAIGANAFGACTGNQGVAVGTQAGQGLTSSDGAVVIGYQALNGASSSNYMVAIGYKALYTSGSITNTIAIGYQAGYNNTSGSTNVIIGRNAALGSASWTGDYNTLIGDEVAGDCAGSYNHTLAIGRQAAYSIGGGAIQMILAIGNQALKEHDGSGDHSTGGYTMAVGHNSLQNDRHIRHSTVVGLNAVHTWAPTTGQQSIHTAGYTALGSGSMYNHRHGGANIGIGRDAMRGTNNSSGGTGNDNIAIGDRACENLTSGYRNVSIGRFANLRVESGYANVAIGWIANYAYDATNSTTNGYSNTIIGYYTRTSGYNSHDETVLGSGGVGKGTNTAFICGSSGAYQQNNSSSWSTTSDIRIKKNIVDNTTGLDKINQVRVRNFEYREEQEITDFKDKKGVCIDKKGIQLGVIAQEIEEVLPDTVETQSTGVKTVNPDNLTWYLVNAVKELSAEVKALKQQINS